VLCAHECGREGVVMCAGEKMPRRIHIEREAVCVRAAWPMRLTATSRICMADVSCVGGGGLGGHL